MNILLFPNPLLFEVMPEVTVFGEELKILLDSMYDLMKNSNGMGLAANQVGLSLRMFVMEGPNGRVNLVNPKIVVRSKFQANLREGCLSAPGDFVTVPSRAEWVDVGFQDEEGTYKRLVLKGIFAVCFQHELDHLNGKTFLSDKSIPRNIRKPLAKKWKL